MSKQNGFPGAETVKRHAKTGVQDDTYLIESPFLRRKGERRRLEATAFYLGEGYASVIQARERRGRNAESGDFEEVGVLAA